MAFNTTFVSAEGLMRRFHVEVPEEWVKGEEDQAASEVAKMISVKGFRKGKVPPALAKKTHPEQVLRLVLDAVMPAILGEDIKNLGYLAVADPHISEVKREKDKGLSLSCAVAAVEKTSVPDFRQWTLDRRLYPVSDEDVARRIAEIREKCAKWKKLEGRGAEMGDLVLADLQLLENGVPVLGKKTKDPLFLILGQNTLGPDTDRQMLGVLAGEDRRVVFLHPGDQPDTSPKREHLVTVRQVLQKILPEIDEVFYRQVSSGAAETAEAFEDLVRGNLERGAVVHQRSDSEAQIRDRLARESSLDPPEATVDVQVRQMEAGMDQDARSRLTDEDHRRIWDDAARRVKAHLLLEAVSLDACVTVSSSEIDGLSATMEKADRDRKVEWSEEKRRENRANVATFLRHSKTVDHILSQVAFRDV